MDPRVWGTDLWNSLHRISLVYPLDPTPSHKEDAFHFFRSLGKMLPCPWCTLHYSTYFDNTFVQQEANKNRESLTKWVYNLHDSVNKRLGKQESIPFEKLPLLYMTMPERYSMGKLDQTFSLNPVLSQESLIIIIISGFVIAVLLAIMIAVIISCKAKKRTEKVMLEDSPLFLSGDGQ